MRTRVLKPEVASESLEGRLDRSIYEAAVQYLGFVDADEPSDYLDAEEGRAIHRGCVMGEDSFLRIVLLCEARARLDSDQTAGTDPRPKWTRVADRIFAVADGHQSDQKLNRGFLSDRPSAASFQQEIHKEMLSRLVDPQTFHKVDAGGHTDIEFAASVASGNIQIEYS